jgi:prepilin-type N-terminal cleavage/methylation domain-containing protein
MNDQIESRSRGFTLIELMVAVAIVAILTALAYPSYRNYVLRGQLVDATNALSALRADMERYFQDTRSYATVGGIPSPCAAPTQLKLFNIACTAPAAANPPTFQLVATGIGSTAGFVFKVDQTGAQSTTVAGVKGWSSCNTAWVTKAGAC